jgi:hypothetical protein
MIMQKKLFRIKIYEEEKILKKILLQELKALEKYYGKFNY